MLFGPEGRQSLVSDEFNDKCTAMRVEASVSPAPNPGDPFNSVRIVNFRNFNNHTVKITQFNKKRTVTVIPTQGAAQIMLLPGEEFPQMEKGE